LPELAAIDSDDCERYLSELLGCRPSGEVCWAGWRESGGCDQVNRAVNYDPCAGWPRELAQPAPGGHHSADNLDLDASCPTVEVQEKLSQTRQSHERVPLIAGLCDLPAESSQALPPLGLVESDNLSVR